MMQNNESTTASRRKLGTEIQESVRSEDVVAERERLISLYGQVWDTSELTAEYTVKAYLYPFVFVTEKSTGKKGSLMFQHSPRLYFCWEPFTQEQL